jgi:CheY-like chemotaxis protein/nitrogen-specific signal transduction histidine kinase
LLDRPVAARVLVSAIEVAVRSRMRQYETRELIAREQAARIEAERAAHSRDEFLAVVSHELRTPLHSIFGWTQILKRKPPSHEILSEGLDVIERGARAQTRLIEDILDMSRINSGKIHLEFKEVWMRPIVEAAIETIQPEAQTKGLQIETALDSNTGPILGDAARLQQVVLNLLSNAVKFTPPAGRIEVITRQLNHQLEIIVNNTGLGIDPGFLPHVFDRFRQADSSSARHFGGLGLGLAIVKQLVELHGGKVSAFSAGKNQGASFRVDLPLLRTASEREPLALHEHTHGNLFWDLSGVTVLVVDDDHDAVDIMKIMFEESNASVLTAHSGVEGLRMLECATPDILVSDIGMPGMDGFEFIRRVRCAGQNIPAIAVTAFARVEDSTRAIEAGFSSHVAKPVDPARLLSTIQSLVHTREHATG